MALLAPCRPPPVPRTPLTPSFASHVISCVRSVPLALCQPRRNTDPAPCPPSLDLTQGGGGCCRSIKLVRQPGRPLSLRRALYPTHATPALCLKLH